MRRTELTTTLQKTRNHSNKRGATLRRAFALASLLAIAPMFPSRAYALDPGLLLTVPALIDEILLLVTLVAIVFAFKVYNLVRGGLMAKSWQFFFVGLCCLALAQIVQISGATGMFLAPDLTRPVLLLSMGGLWLYGAIKARKALG
ncbi:MAG: hypothetical protein ACE5GA_04085 [Candidatus Zixiibacteriota bacterium]